MDVDNDVLIALVFDKQPLWDKKNKFHSNRNVTDRCWKEISLEMKQDEIKLRKRWRYLRDQFAVELGKIPPSRSGDEVITVCPKWPYFKSLLFLKQVVKARASTGSLMRRRSPSGSADRDAERFPVSPSHSPRITEDGDESDQPKVPPAMYTFQTASKRLKKSLNDKMLDIEHQKLKCLQEKQKSRQNQPDADNEHLLFFKSLLPHIDKIPQHMILGFRNRIQSVVDEFAYCSVHYDNPSSSTTNYSHLSNVSCQSTPETCGEIIVAQTSRDNIADVNISNRVVKEEYNESTQSEQNDLSVADFF